MKPLRKTTAHGRGYVATRNFVAQLREALRPTDPQRTSSAVRVYSPTGQLLETVSPDAWATRYPRRFASRRRWGWR